GGARRRCDDLAAVLANPCTARAACALVARDSPVRLDLEPVHPLDRPRRRSHEADDGRSPGSVPGAMGSRYPAPLGRIAADPHADADRLPRLPAPLRRRSAPGIAEGLSADDAALASRQMGLGLLVCARRAAS